MRAFRNVGAVAIAVFALGAVAGPASAEFTYSEPGELTGSAEATQVFTTNAGAVECTAAHTKGAITATTNEDIHVTTTYSGCTAFGVAKVDISPATYTFTTDDIVHITEPIVIRVTKTLFTKECTVTIKAQTVETITYKNLANGTVTVEPNVTWIHYVGNGGVCGSGTAENGIFNGSSIIERVGGGTFSVDH